jgi:hypothetical protein
MPELPTCDCISGYPPYDRLTFIYQAAAELSGDTSLPAVECVAGVPPFDRFSYIYAAFRVLAGDDSLPSQECVEGESYQNQVTRIYQAARLYAADSGLPAVDCVRGLPIWQQWHSIYTALYSLVDEYANPNCVPFTFDVLNYIYCALIAGCETPVVESADYNLDLLVITFNVPVTGFNAGANGFELTIAGNPAQIDYIAGSGTNVVSFSSDIEAALGDEVLLSYTPGVIANGNCPLLGFSNFEVTNNTGVEFTYRQPGGVDTYLRPDGTSIFLRP